MSFTPRLFLATALSPEQKEITLDESASRYLIKVLRLEPGARFFGFDAQAIEYEVQLLQTDVIPATAAVLSRHEKRELGRAIGLPWPKACQKDRKSISF